MLSKITAAPALAQVMRCAGCCISKPPASFTKSQRRKPADARKCSACAAEPADAAAADANTVAGSIPRAPAAAGPEAPKTAPTTHTATGAGETRRKPWLGVPVPQSDSDSDGWSSDGTNPARNTPPPPVEVVAPGGALVASQAAEHSEGPRITPARTAAATATAPPNSDASVARAAATAADIHHSAASPKFCAWPGCGRQLPADLAKQSRCGQCKQALYCGRQCQKRHWGRGGHKKVCVEPPYCTICLNGGDDPLPIQCGCACRGAAGLAHIACRAEVAAHKDAGFHEGWCTCTTCGQDYTGAMGLGLARESVSRLSKRRRETTALGRQVYCRFGNREDYDRLAAANHLGAVLTGAGMLAEAANVLAGALAAAKRKFGKEHPNTLISATHLANAYHQQDDVESLSLAGSKAEELYIWVHEVNQRLNGDEHLDTIDASANLARAYAQQGRLAEAEAIEVKVLEARRQVLGTEHSDTLRASASLAVTYNKEGKLAKAAAMQEAVLATSRRVLGAGHPGTRLAASNLGCTYGRLGRNAEAATLETLYSCE